VFWIGKSFRNVQRNRIAAFGSLRRKLFLFSHRLFDLHSQGFLCLRIDRRCIRIWLITPRFGPGFFGFRLGGQRFSFGQPGFGLALGGPRL